MSAIYDRFSIVHLAGLLLGTEMNRAAAFRQAEQWSDHCDPSDIVVRDAMAHIGCPQEWQHDGETWKVTRRRQS